jgi:glycosyltransferase involved in cell wall biosynthesis
MTGPAGLVSVILPVRDGGDLFTEQLAALSRQTYSGRWEVVVADNGSADGSADRAKSWANRLPGLVVVDASDRPGAAHARNVGAQHARGDVLAFCDADDVVDENWLTALLAGLQGADLVAGAIETDLLNDPLVRRWRPFDVGAVPISHGWLPYALSANVAFRRSVFMALEGFREDYRVGEDVEICWRAQLNGHRFAYTPEAVVHYRFRAGLRPLLRQYVAYGTIGPRLFQDFRDEGMPASGLRAAVGPWVRLVTKLPIALLSTTARGDVLRRMAFRLGRIRGSLQVRVLYL